MLLRLCLRTLLLLTMLAETKLWIHGPTLNKARTASRSLRLNVVRRRIRGRSD